MSRLRAFLTTWVVAALASAGAARADESLSTETALARDHALTVQLGPAVYVQLSSPVELLAGPKLRLGYARAVARPFRLELGLGITRGGCFTGTEVGACIGRRGTAFEPTIGIGAEHRLGARSWLSGQMALGTLFLRRSAFPTGGGVLARVGGGVRGLVSPNVALGGDLSGALGWGHYLSSDSASMVSVEMGFVVETRF